jgi:hypothetical protein
VHVRRTGSAAARSPGIFRQSAVGNAMFFSRKWIIGTLLLLGLVEVILIVSAGRNTSRNTVSTIPPADTLVRLPAVDATVPDGGPTVVKFGLLAESELPGGIDEGVSRALESLKAKGQHSAEIVRCVVIKPNSSSKCTNSFRQAGLSAIIANPDVDATDLLKELSNTDLPYVGIFPVSPEELTNHNSFQLAPGMRGVTFAPLRWARDTAAPSIVYVSAPETRTNRDLVTAAAGKAKLTVQGFDFATVGTDVSRYLDAVNGKKPVLVFDTAANGCTSIIRGLTRRRSALAGRMEATFLPDVCAKEIKAASLDGLRAMTARPFAIDLTEVGGASQIAGEYTIAAINDALPNSVWNTGQSFRAALGTAVQPAPQNSVGSWNCASRLDPAAPALCGQQVLVTGQSPDTQSLRVWIDALSP